jgi:MFS family permease
MVVGCAGLVTYGILTTFLGATLPELRLRLGLSLEHSGALFSVFYVAQISMVFVAGPLIDRFGKKPVLVGGSFLAAATLAACAYAPNYAVLAGAVFLLGVGAIFISSGTNTLVADLYPQNPSSALNVGHTFYGLGAVLFPVLAAFLATRFGLMPPVWLTALLVVGVATLGATQVFPATPPAEGFDWYMMRKAMLDPAVLVLACVVFLAAAVALSITGWIRVYLEQEYHTAARTSGLVLALFWLTTSVGRFVSSQLVKKVHAPSLVLWGSLVMTAGLFLVAVAPDISLVTVGIVVSGFGYGPIYPTTVGYASTFSLKYFGTVFAVLQSAGLAGGMLLPALIGHVARGTSLRMGIWLAVGTALLLLPIQVVFISYERGHRSQPGSK